MAVDTPMVPQARGTLDQARVSELLQKLAELGGSMFKEDDIVYEGDKLILPTRFKGQLDRAIMTLHEKMAEEEAPADFTRTYNYRPWDGAYNAFMAMKEHFGLVIGKATKGFFGDTPPQYIQVPISTTETEEVPWGDFKVPLLPQTTITFYATKTPEYGQVFGMKVNSPRKNRFIIEGLFKLVGERIANHSIYKGKAIDGADMPGFIDLSGVNPANVVYSQQVRTDLEAHVWGFMKHDATYRDLDMSAKRSVLLYGPYGTGKSLTANLTAMRATAAGWTFIMARPGKDNFFDVLQTARLYQPCAVFMEDADTLAEDDDASSISKLLDVFDGINAKSQRVMIVMTTNHPDRLDPGMRRPGRIDQFIEIAGLDAAGVGELVRRTLGATAASDVNYDAVAAACADYSPAFVREAADRAIRYAIARDPDPANLRITTDDLVHSANSLRPQFIWTTGTQPEEPDRFGPLLVNAVKAAIGELAPAGRNYVDEQVWDTDAIRDAQALSVG